MIWQWTIFFWLYYLSSCNAALLYVIVISQFSLHYLTKINQLPFCFSIRAVYINITYLYQSNVIVILAQEYCVPALHNNRRIPNQQQVSFSCVTPYTFMMAVGDKYASLYSISPCISIFFDGNWHIFLRNFASAATSYMGR